MNHTHLRSTALSITIAAFAAAPGFAQTDGFQFPVNDPSYPTPTLEIGTDFVFEAEQGLRTFDDGVAFTPEEVYEVIEGDNLNNGKAVQFILADPGGRFSNWSLTFPFILPEESEVRIIYRVSFFTDPDGSEGKAFVKMDENEYDMWPPDFFGFDPAVFGGMEFPPDDGGGWIQVNNWSNFQRQNFSEEWGEKGDFRSIWVEGNWFDQTPSVEMLAWQLPAGEHVFKMTPRSGGNFSVDYVAILTSDFERFLDGHVAPPAFPFDPTAAQTLEVTQVGDFMLY